MEDGFRLNQFLRFEDECPVFTIHLVCRILQVQCILHFLHLEGWGVGGPGPIHLFCRILHVQYILHFLHLGGGCSHPPCLQDTTCTLYNRSYTSHLGGGRFFFFDKWNFIYCVSSYDANRVFLGLKLNGRKILKNSFF